MGQIYSRSTLVISWLGPANAITHSAMETCALISEELRKSAEEAGDYPERFGDHLTRVDWLEKHPRLCHVDVPEVDRFFGNRLWDAIRHFLGLEYWTRIWILQEVVLGQQVLLLCGQKLIEFFDVLIVAAWKNSVIETNAPKPNLFHDSIWMLITSSELVPWKIIYRIGSLRSKIALDRDQTQKTVDGRRFSTFGQELRSSQPKDHIYGLLALTELDFVPDYSHNATVEDVYIDYVKKWLQAARQGVNDIGELHFMSIAGIGVFDEPSTLPTWVPNYPAASAVGGVRFPVTGAADHGVFEDTVVMSPVIEDHTLHVSGVSLGKVSYITKVVAEEVSDNTLVPYIYSFASKDTTYVSGISRLGACFDALLGFQIHTTEKNNISLSINLALGFLAILVRLYAPSHESHSNEERCAGWKIPTESPASFAKWFQKNFFPVKQKLSNDMGSALLKALMLRLDDPEFNKETITALFLLTDYRLFETGEGYIGLGPRGMDVGDFVCVLKVSRVPILLRKLDGTYANVGSCFLCGFMKGYTTELLRNSGFIIERFAVQ